MKKFALGTNAITFGGPLSSIHAEVDSMTKFRKLNRHRRFVNLGDTIDILVIKLSKTGRLGYSRPCKNCIGRMSKYEMNIGTVYYSDENQDIVAERFHDLFSSDSTRHSRGTRSINNIRAERRSKKNYRRGKSKFKTKSK